MEIFFHAVEEAGYIQAPYTEPSLMYDCTFPLVESHEFIVDTMCYEKAVSMFLCLYVHCSNIVSGNAPG